MITSNYDHTGRSSTINSTTPKHRQYTFYLQVTKQVKLEGWTEKIMAMNNLMGIYFEDEEEYAFDKQFWEGISEFMKVMSTRSVEMEFFMCEGSSLSYSLHNVPLTSLGIDIMDNFPEYTHYPKTLTQLAINGTFGELVGLPDTLTQLDIMSKEWNHPIKPGTLPIGLKKLSFGYGFNQPIGKDTLPPSLESLDFGVKFNQPLTNIPKSVTKLCVDEAFQHPIDNQLLRKLSHKGVAVFAPGVAFPKLTKLVTEREDDKQVSLPSSTFPCLKTLSLRTMFRTWSESLDLSMSMTSSLRLLEIMAYGPITSFPQGIQKLRLIDSCEQSFVITNTTLPRTLRSFSIRRYHHKFESDHFPPALTSLKLIDIAQWPLPSQLPATLRSLRICCRESKWVKEHLETILAMTSLDRIKLEANGHSFSLFRINDTLFLKYLYSVLGKFTECEFIDIDGVLKKLRIK
ncbi:hypothetical protein SAMD00019534_013770 [Acytostelium subglobosum LB1]|uniref:hypothetical protein n=1 Tax=Acytostelium subglobosum LB1 TaxID=1410327 RepID=UPI000644A228|nr:hypothetical protein SAMD00019534_013770 [Acytostelium subglobosum LB1]GAM18202.1 hypothetical protein SAMD00019534_013770 [Acytostelium subglobosum LB1]|eukprot:XP_012758798.1 hypothetical protein SAMD00019534_013770 [Acytostelium subglobosum LB1]